MQLNLRNINIPPASPSRLHDVSFRATVAVTEPTDQGFEGVLSPSRLGSSSDVEAAAAMVAGRPAATSAPQTAAHAQSLPARRIIVRCPPTKLMVSCIGVGLALLVALGLFVGGPLAVAVIGSLGLTGLLVYVRRSVEDTIPAYFPDDHMLLPNPEFFVGGPAALQRAYADIVACDGIFGSDVEAKAVSHRIRVNINIWSLEPPHGQPEGELRAVLRVCHRPVSDTPLPRVDIIFDESRVHYQRLEIPADRQRQNLLLEPQPLMRDVAGDGNCMFRAIEAGLPPGSGHNHRSLRAAAAMFLRDGAISTVVPNYRDSLVQSIYAAFELRFRRPPRLPMAKLVPDATAEQQDDAPI